MTPNPAKITSQWAKLFDLTSRCPFHPQTPSFLFRRRSHWTPITWSTGWRISTRQVTIRCWRGRKRSFGGPRCARLERWLPRPPALWSWSSLCPYALWSHEVLQVVLYEVLQVTHFPPALFILANCKRTEYVWAIWYQSNYRSSPLIGYVDVWRVRYMYCLMWIWPMFVVLESSVFYMI